MFDAVFVDNREIIFLIHEASFAGEAESQAGFADMVDVIFTDLKTKDRFNITIVFLFEFGKIIKFTKDVAVHDFDAIGWHVVEAAKETNRFIAEDHFFKFAATQDFEQVTARDAGVFEVEKNSFVFWNDIKDVSESINSIFLAHFRKGGAEAVEKQVID